MDRAIAERAVRALTALNTRPRSEHQPSRVSSTRSVEAAQFTAPSSEERAACESPQCGGCYEVEPGVQIHPPRSGKDWKEWLLNWEPKGRVQ
jgi:hypothetical protein